MDVDDMVLSKLPKEHPMIFSEKKYVDFVKTGKRVAIVRLKKQRSWCCWILQFECI